MLQPHGREPCLGGTPREAAAAGSSLPGLLRHPRSGAPGGRSLTEGTGLLGGGSGVHGAASPARASLLGGACGRHLMGQGDAASRGLCGLAAREVLMHPRVDLAELLQGSNVDFYSPQVLRVDVAVF